MARDPWPVTRENLNEAKCRSYSFQHGPRFRGHESRPPAAAATVSNKPLLQSSRTSARSPPRSPTPSACSPACKLKCCGSIPTAANPVITPLAQPVVPRRRQPSPPNFKIAPPRSWHPLESSRTGFSLSSSDFSPSRLAKTKADRLKPSVLHWSRRSRAPLLLCSNEGSARCVWV